jgi:hypothetical protein
MSDSAVLYSFLLYVMCFLLPLIPAVIIFRLFPSTEVGLEGPLQGLTINATGAFAAYVVTVLLGFFVVKSIQTQIIFSRQYPIEGVLLNVADNQIIDSDQFYLRCVSGPMTQTHDCYFVGLFNTPVQKGQMIDFNYLQYTSSGGTNPQPKPMRIRVPLAQTASPQRFILTMENGQPVIKPET